ncbi:Fic family protein [Alloprevotella sp. OH1205_COT-284]|uniref:Fic family protein n=1 Tax=Alloprevotella sp. OH1205_COT-284 TaxID=2491043 RepID=UPI000F5E0B55|nr:Fic family protein [Alloprevotella sp. OH1205_COT-284]RRD79825.1 Fic family protein [Alloprevotella sp. OH1205_COT-284]
MNVYLQQLLEKADALRTQLSGHRPFSPAALAKVQQALDIAYTFESNRIEGNTLTLQETALVVEEGLTIGGKSMREHLEAINHFEAIAFIKEIARQELPVTQQLILQIHALILRGIDRANAGRWRTVPVLISGSRHTPPPPFMIAEEMEHFINEFERRENEGEHPVLLAAFLHERLVNIHPFVDGNGRTSRLLMNLYLLRRGYVIVNIKGDLDHRLRYYTALEESHTKAHSQSFRQLVAEKEIEALQAYLKLLS